MVTKLTNGFVKRIECKSGLTKEEIYDDTLKGFLLEIKSNNRKTFYLKLQTVNKTMKYHRIGDASLMNADTARIKALKLKKMIEEGKEVIVQSPPLKIVVPTLKEFYNNNYLPYVQKHIKSHETNISVFKNHLLPAFGNIKMDKITKLDILKIHTEIVYKKKMAPASANKLLIFISHAFHLALEYKIKGISENPAKGIKPFIVNNEIQRFITKKETKRLMDEVTKSDNIHLKYIVPMLIL